MTDSKPKREVMTYANQMRFVKVVPPTVHAGIGNALRKAFVVDAEKRDSAGFEDLLARLN